MGDGDVDPAPRVRPDHPKVCCGPVAQDRFWAGGEHRGHPSSLTRDQPVADGVDAGMELMEAPGPQAPADCSRLKAKAQQLLTRNHPVLALREFGDLMLAFASPRECSHIGH